MLNLTTRLQEKNSYFTISSKPVHLFQCFFTECFRQNEFIFQIEVFFQNHFFRDWIIFFIEWNFFDKIKDFFKGGAKILFKVNSFTVKVFFSEKKYSFFLKTYIFFSQKIFFKVLLHMNKHRDQHLLHYCLVHNEYIHAKIFQTNLRTQQELLMKGWRSSNSLKILRVIEIRWFAKESFGFNPKY